MRSIIAVKNAFFYSMSGLKYLLKERAFCQELIVMAVLIVIEMFRDTSLNMRLYLFTSYMLILLAEALNSAIEATVDRISHERHELSKKAKDIGSAATFIMMLHFGIIWLLSFIL
ncbi:MAG: diacylglycerol kinase [Alphaproteobacteria bacterium]|nr:diacylglycerol kinase [Alphaproteobacteria bacterium]MBQ3944808.1 diacylglycerol kinase [Alphaproteobacteria bacterium]